MVCCCNLSCKMPQKQNWGWILPQTFCCSGRKGREEQSPGERRWQEGVGVVISQISVPYSTSTCAALCPWLCSSPREDFLPLSFWKSGNLLLPKLLPSWNSAWTPAGHVGAALKLLKMCCLSWLAECSQQSSSCSTICCLSLPGGCEFSRAAQLSVRLEREALREGVWFSSEEKEEKTSESPSKMIHLEVALQLRGHSTDGPVCKGTGGLQLDRLYINTIFQEFCGSTTSLG